MPGPVNTRFFRKSISNKSIVIMLIIIVVVQGFFLYRFYSRKDAKSSNLVAIESLKQYKDIDSEIAAGRKYLSEANSELNPEKFDNAIKVFNDISSKKRDNYYPYMMAGWGYYQKAYFFNKFDLYLEAIRNFKNAIELNPNDYRSYEGLGWVYTRFENFELALKNFDSASKLSPSDHVSLNGKAFVFKQLGLLNKSVEFSKEAIRLYPTETDYYDVLGWTYHELGLLKESKEQFMKSATIDPQNHIALDGMGWDLDHEEKFTEAVEYLQKSIKIHPYYQNYEGLGRAYYGLKDYDKSIQSIFKELEFLSNNSVAWKVSHPYAVLGWSYYRLRNYENAIKYFRDYLKTNDDDRAKLGLVSALFQEQKNQEAKDVLSGIEMHGSGSIDPHHLDHHNQMLQRSRKFLDCLAGKVLNPETVSKCVESNPSFGI